MVSGAHLPRPALAKGVDEGRSAVDVVVVLGAGPVEIA